MGGRSRNSRKKYRKTKPQRILIRCGFLVGAGGCREPRRKGTRVAAPSGCIVPWAARASCWPQPQQLLPVSAAGSGRRCCTGAFPRRTIRRVDAVRIHPCSPFSRQIKQKLRYPLDTGVLGGRVWIARAALLKTTHWAVFALSSATAPQLFESTRPMSLALLQNKNLSVLYTLRFFGGAKQPKSEPLPSGASLAAISSKVMVFVPSL